MRTLQQTMVIAILLALFTGCSTAPERKPFTPDSMSKLIDQAIASHSTQPQVDTGSVTPPAAVSNELLPPISVDLPMGQIELIEERFDISVNRARARDFFIGLVKDTRYNMVVHPNVKGRISLDLKNVTIPEVMETIRDVYGHEYRQSGNHYRVLPAELQSRIFKINYLNVRRSGNSMTRVSSGQVSASGGDGGGSSAEASSQIQTLSDADFWKELATSLDAIIGDKDGRKVVVTPQSGIIIVRAMPAELREVSDYLEATSDIIHRQVILEAKILEVELNDGYQAGINWSALGTGGSDSVVIGQTGGGTLLDGSGLSEISGNTGILDPSALSQIQGTASSAFGGAFSMALNTTDFTAFIELLKSQGDVQVLSSPRVSTMNNQKAVIKVGSDEFFVTKVSSDTTTSGGATTTAPEVELTPFFSGIGLDVIPQIDDEGNVILHIHPTVSEVTDQTKVFTIGGLTQALPLAFSTVRESDSIVRAKSGQVVVLGGLMQNQSREETASTPFLGDLPLIGALFRHTKQVSRKSELVILLKPIVIDSDETWRQVLKESRSRMSQIENGLN